jgi:hypothetical protein
MVPPLSLRDYRKWAAPLAVAAASLIGPAQVAAPDQIRFAEAVLANSRDKG